MSTARSATRRIAPLLFAVALLVPAFVTMAATPTVVTGTLTLEEEVTLGPEAVAVVVLVDRTASAEGGQIIGVQRIDGPGNAPIPFSVTYDEAAIQKTHAYAVFASLTDKDKTWQSLNPTPVITGGPTSGVELPLVAVPAQPLAAVSGTIQTADLATIPGATEVIAALIKVDTGTIVGSQVQTTTSSAVASPSASPSSSGGPGGLTALPFSIGYDPVRHRSRRHLRRSICGDRRDRALVERRRGSGHHQWCADGPGRPDRGPDADGDPDPGADLDADPDGDAGPHRGANADRIRRPDGRSRPRRRARLPRPRRARRPSRLRARHPSRLRARRRVRRRHPVRRRARRPAPSRAWSPAR